MSAEEPTNFVERFYGVDWGLIRGRLRGMAVNGRPRLGREWGRLVAQQNPLSDPGRAQVCLDDLGARIAALRGGSHV